MLEEIKGLLKSAEHLKDNTGNDIPEHKLILAIAVLLLEMAGADDDFDPEEVKSCFRSLERLFALTDTEALQYLEEAEAVRSDKETVSHLIETLNQHFSEEQRVIVLSLVWKIVVADQKIEKHELRLANQIRVRLQLSESQGEEARTLAFGDTL